MTDVLSEIHKKMIRRHPHVFGDAQAASVDTIRENWEQIKKEVEHKGEGEPSLTEGLSRNLSALARTQLITARASAVGFDWDSAAEVLKKVEEELSEFRTALEAGNQTAMKRRGRRPPVYPGESLPFCRCGCRGGASCLSGEIHQTLCLYRTDPCQTGNNACRSDSCRNGRALE